MCSVLCLYLSVFAERGGGGCAVLQMDFAVDIRPHTRACQTKNMKIVFILCVTAVMAQMNFDFQVPKRYSQCWAAILKNVSLKAIQIHNF
jgi:hypothetical protein